MAGKLERHHDELHRRPGGHGRVAAILLQQRDLAEEIARPQLVEALPVAGDVRAARLDHEELVTEIALLCQHLSGGATTPLAATLPRL
jgi:hypothetical protein